MHVHLGGYDGARRTLSLLLTNGITGVRDMASPLDDILRMRHEVRDGALVGPRLVVAGPLLQGPLPQELRRMPLLISIETTARAASTVDMLQTRGVDFIKVPDALPRDIYLAIAEAAQRNRLPLAGHIPPTVTAIEAANAGQDSIEHLGGRFHGVYVSTSRDAQQLLLDGTRMYSEAIRRDRAQRRPISFKSSGAIRETTARELRRRKGSLALEALRPSWHVAMSDARYAASTLGTRA